MKVTKGCLGASLVMLLAACSHLRGTEHAAGPAPPQQPIVDADSVARLAAAAQPSNDAIPVDVPAAPPCSCIEAKRRSKPKPRPKPVRREAPPQLPTAPVVAESPPGALIDAQVKPMNVSVMSILGKRVKGPKGEDLGRVVDVLADASGRVRVAIIDFGGFLGVGNHRIAVDWPLLRFSPDGQDPSLLLSLSLEKLKTAPEYKDDPRPRALVAPGTVAPPTAPGSTSAAPSNAAGPSNSAAPAAPTSAVPVVPAALPALAKPPLPAVTEPAAVPPPAESRK